MLPDNFFNHIIKVEGEFVNHPMDRGGPTKYGITFKTLSTYRGRGVTVDDVGFLTEVEAKKIYNDMFFENYKIHLLASQKIQLILFDQGVLWGPVTAIKKLQNVLNLNPFYSKLKVDGVLGPETIKKINLLNENDMGRKYLQRAQDDFVSFVVKDPSQLVFLRGWINRTHLLWDSMEENEYA